MSSHSTFDTNSFETTFALSLDNIHFISITFLVLLVLVRDTLQFLCFRFRDVRTHLLCIHWNWSCGLCGNWGVRVGAHSWRDCTNFLCRMTLIHHVYISTLSRLLQHVITNFVENAVLQLLILRIQDFFRRHVSHGVGLYVVLQLSWSTTLKLFQTTFPSVESPWELSDIQHSCPDGSLIR